VIVTFAIVRAKKGKFESKLLRNNVIPLMNESLSQTEPLIVPIFGKARALTVISGEKLSETAITNVAYYVTGSCSCEIKTQNPGIDLFIPLSWDSEIAAMEQNKVSDKLPDVSVPTITTKITAPVYTTGPLVEAGDDESRIPQETGLLKMAAISLGFLVFIAIAGTLLMGRMKGKD
jgi:hypothetical protein